MNTHFSGLLARGLVGCSLLLFALQAIAQTSPTFQVPTWATLKSVAAPQTNSRVTAVLAGKWAAGDGGAGVLVWSSTATNVDNGGVFATPNTGSGAWIRQAAEPWNALWWGAGAAGDQTTNVQAAVNAAKLSNKALIIPGGITYTWGSLTNTATMTIEDYSTPGTKVIRGTLTATIALSGDGSSVTNLNADNIASGTVADARVASTIARDSEVSAYASNADNITSGTVADARIASTIARDSEVTAAVGNADNLTSGTVADARIASTIARDSETASAISDHSGAADPHTGYATDADVSAKQNTITAGTDGATMISTNGAWVALEYMRWLTTGLNLGGGLVMSNAQTLSITAGSTVIDTTKARSQFTTSTNLEFTFSAAPAAGTAFMLVLTNSGTTNIVVTIPDSESAAVGGTRTSFTMKPGWLLLTWLYDGTDYYIAGDPIYPNEFTEDPTPNGTNLVVMFDQATYTYRTVRSRNLASLPRYVTTLTANDSTTNYIADLGRFPAGTSERAGIQVITTGDGVNLKHATNVTAGAETVILIRATANIPVWIPDAWPRPAGFVNGSILTNATTLAVGLTGLETNNTNLLCTIGIKTPFYRP